MAICQLFKRYFYGTLVIYDKKHILRLMELSRNLVLSLTKKVFLDAYL